MIEFCNDDHAHRFALSTSRASEKHLIQKALGKADVAQLISVQSGLSKASIELVLTSFAEVVREEVRKIG